MIAFPPGEIFVHVAEWCQDVSLLADAGFDFLMFDTQHSPWEISSFSLR